MTEQRDVICTISVQVQNEDPLHIGELRRELHLFLISVGARILRGPTDEINNTKTIHATFEIYPRMRETVENFYHLTAMYPKHYESTISFNKIEPLNEPAIGFIVG